MHGILILMISGMVFGLFLREKKSLLKWVNRIVLFIIFLLLFVLGLSVGANRTLISQFPEIGKTALILTVSSILGTGLVLVLMQKLFFRKPPHEK